jgi:phosphoenolpyruvate carboxykinase (GTP)
MAMKPFAGYNFGDYWAHWLNVGRKLTQPPKIFHVNWFRQDAAGKFLWPGFGDNLRVLNWIVDRCKGTAGARDTAIGALPSVADLNTQGLDLAPGAAAELLNVDLDLWREEMLGIGTYMQQFAVRLPKALQDEHAAAVERLTTASQA